MKEFLMRLLPVMMVLLALGKPTSSLQALPALDSAPWDAVLKQFVNANHRVDYARLKKDGALRLNEYIARLGRPGIFPASLNEKKALLINAYNAFTIQWIVKNYPIKSIWSTDSPFTAPRHKLDGKMVSLNEIESQLRAMRDPRIHAALVCAARSCPPLRREAYVAGRLDEQLDDNVREWLANPSLNRFYPLQGKAEISPILKWYRKDFDAYPGGLQGFLRKYAPQQSIEELGGRKLEISFPEYDWGLNDQSDLGGNYSRLQYAIDWVENWLRSLTN
ncbi:MAG: DUF547 domain-containing protein [Acidobacteria bacterium]|nr:MAG: DUF547 domain-containing protein [Acidobacteriota bacterium]